MDRFGSSKLRIGWALACLFLAGLVFMGIRGQDSPDGAQLIVFGTVIPQGFESLSAQALASLGRLVYTLVPATVLLAGFFPLAQWTASPAPGERLQGLFLGTILAFLQGLFFSQLLLLPLWAASARLLGRALPPELLRADALALMLGLQLLLWGAVMARLLRSSAGMALLFTFALRELGGLMAWGGEFLGDLDVPAKLVKLMAFLGHLLPSAQLPTEAFKAGHVALALAGPLLLGALVVLIPSAAPAKAAGTGKAKKGK